ncbi:MAG: hypothetical protein ABJC07_06450 [Acidobacteriota bacterium]
MPPAAGQLRVLEPSTLAAGSLRTTLLSVTAPPPAEEKLPDCVRRDGTIFLGHSGAANLSGFGRRDAGK